MRRRDFVRAGGVIGIGVLAGCSGNGGNKTSEGTGTDQGGNNGTPDTEEGTPEETTDADAEESTATETDEPDGESTQSYEDDESELEAQLEEERQDRIFDNWIEFENLAEQIPKQNYTLDEFPALEILQYKPTVGDNTAYDPENETVYLGWGEKDGKMALDVQVVYEWGGSLQDSSGHAEVSTNHTDEAADIEGILTNVVEGYTELSEDMEEEYRDLL